MDLLEEELEELVEEHRFRCLHLLALQQQLVVVQHQLGACRRCHRCWPSSFVRLGLGLHHQPHPLPLLHSRQLLVERHRLELRNQHYPCLVLHPCRHLCQDLCRHRMHPYPYPCPCLCQGRRQHPCLERHPCLELHPYLESLLPCLVSVLGLGIQCLVRGHLGLVLCFLSWCGLCAFCEISPSFYV